MAQNIASGLDAAVSAPNLATASRGHDAPNPLQLELTPSLVLYQSLNRCSSFLECLIVHGSAATVMTSSSVEKSQPLIVFPRSMACWRVFSFTTSRHF